MKTGMKGIKFGAWEFRLRNGKNKNNICISLYVLQTMYATLAAIIGVNVSVCRTVHDYKFRINRSGILQLKRIEHTQAKRVPHRTGFKRVKRNMYELRRYFAFGS